MAVTPSLSLNCLTQSKDKSPAIQQKDKKTDVSSVGGHSLIKNGVSKLLCCAKQKCEVLFTLQTKLFGMHMDTS